MYCLDTGLISECYNSAVIYFLSFVIGKDTKPYEKRRTKRKLCHFSAWRPQISEAVFTHGSVACLPHTPVDVRPYVFLAMLYDHKLWPDHPRDPAGYCQIGHGTAVIVGSLTTCIQSRNRLLFRRPVAGELGRPGSSFPSEV